MGVTSPKTANLAVRTLVGTYFTTRSLPEMSDAHFMEPMPCLALKKLPAPTWPVGTRCRGLRRMLLELLSTSCTTATPRAQPPHPLPSRISDPPPLRPSRSRSHRPCSLVPSPASSLADRPRAVRSRASDGALHISDPFLGPARIPSPLASLAAGTVRWRSPSPAVAPFLVRSQESAPVARIAADETPPLCRSGS